MSLVPDVTLTEMMSYIWSKSIGIPEIASAILLLALYLVFVVGKLPNSVALLISSVMLVPFVASAMIFKSIFFIIIALGLGGIVIALATIWSKG